MEQSKQRILRSFPPEWEWDNDCDIVVRVWSDEPTPEEIKAQHPRCGSCKQYGFITKDGDPTYIDHVCDWDVMVIEDPDTDYCNHHEPKET